LRFCLPPLGEVGDRVAEFLLEVLKRSTPGELQITDPEVWPPHVVRRNFQKENSATRSPTSPSGASRIATFDSTSSSLNSTEAPWYYNYYGERECCRDSKFHRVMEILLKWLNRRSQRRSFNWQGFKDLQDHFKVPRPRITDKPRVKTSAACLAACRDAAECFAGLKPDAEASISEGTVRENRTPGSVLRLSGNC